MLVLRYFRRVSKTNLAKKLTQKAKQKKLKISGPQMGPAERGYVKKVQNRHKVSRQISTFLENLRARKNTSKSSKSVKDNLRHFWTIFARHQFFWPLLRRSEKILWVIRARAEGGILSKNPLSEPLWEPFSEPFFTVKPIATPLLRTLLRTLPQNPSQNLLRTLLRTLCCRTTP